MKLKHLFLLSTIFSSLLLNSCFLFVPSFYNPWKYVSSDDIVAKFSDERQTGLSKRIKIDGYYCIEMPTRMHIFPWEASLNILSLIFYENGTVAGLEFKKYNTLAITDINLNDSITHYNAFSNKWGQGANYLIDNDTIKIYACDRLGITSPYKVYELKFEIVDSCTLRHFENTCRFRNSKGEYYWHWDYNDIYTFVPCYNLPDQDFVFMKNKKRLWEDENEWREYMERMKTYKKSK